MDVALAADRRRVAELLGHALDYARHRPLAWLGLAQRHHLYTARLVAAQVRKSLAVM